MIRDRPSQFVRRVLQTLLLFFAVAQMAAPLLHAHYADGSAGAAGVHLHLVSVDHLRTGEAGSANEIHDREARTVSAPVEYFRDESLRLLDLPFAMGSPLPRIEPLRLTAPTHFIPVPATVAKRFPKPLPLAPPALT